jgi:glucosylglycerate phosphorylase
MTMMDERVLHAHLIAIYGQDIGAQVAPRLSELTERYRRRLGTAVRASAASRGLALSERDALLITYGDQVTRRAVDGSALRETPLRTLADFCRRYLMGVVSGVHILPFYPWSSDDGFSVIDYRTVDPALGSWNDIRRLGESFRLMFDAVINHISARSDWFQGFLREEPAFRNFFLTVEGDPNLSQVVRPRALPLLTEFETAAGPRRVWTTFSDDQIDLNYAHPPVLLEVADILLDYVARGAEFLRLDAIAYMWKEAGTSCIHLPQTHRIIQLFRAMLDNVAPDVMLITETNVPHADNISYFGDGTNEAQLVYNFALPPLVLHTFQTGNARALASWAAGLEKPSARTTFFNFLASHDGIGLNPVRGILSPADIDAMVRRVQAHGGLVSYKHNPDGSQSPYELNINYFDALNNPHAADDQPMRVARFMAAQSIMLALVGLPGVYFHSLFGSRGWPEGARETGRNRTINRQKCDYDELTSQLDDPDHLRSQVFGRYAHLLAARAASAAFHPLGEQRVFDAGDAVFALLRVSPDGVERVLCLHNARNEPEPVDLSLFGDPDANTANDLLDEADFQVDSGRLRLTLEPCQVRWLRLA